MIRYAFCTVALAAGWAVSALADVPERVEAAFRGWAAEVGAGSAALTLWQDGTPRHDVSLGSWTAQTPIETASLSKAITATCAVTLIDEGIWDAETTSEAVLNAGPSGLGLGALLTHGAGILPDQTQGVMGLWIFAQKSQADVAAERALARSPQQGTQGKFAYNNENYAILGEMIARQTGRSYSDACTDRVLIPAGATGAVPSPRTRGFLPWGGWQMSVTDYARFLEWGFGRGGVISTRAHRLPAQAVSTHVSYGMGMFQRSSGPGYNFWHFGSLCFPLGFNTGSYAVHWQNGWSIVAAYDVCLEAEQMGGLDRAMIGAVFQ